MAKKSAKEDSDSNGANLGFEAKLWLAADKLRFKMADAIEVLSDELRVADAEKSLVAQGSQRIGKWRSLPNRAAAQTAVGRTSSGRHVNESKQSELRRHGITR